jgi:hypothetical protein
MDVRMFSFLESAVNVFVDVRVYPFPPPAGCECEGVFIFNSVDIRVYHQYGRKGVSLCPTSRGGRESVSLSIVNNVNMRVYTFLPTAVWT